MKIKTKDFGILEIEEKDIINFPKGLYAFENSTKFILIERDGNIIKRLQSVENEDPRFIIFDPADIVTGYEPEIESDVLAELQIDEGKKPSVYVIAVVPENIREMTINMKSPVLINHEKNLGMQVMLEKGNYSVRQPVFPKDKEGGLRCLF